jgi:transposase InsO family protein
MTPWIATSNYRRPHAALGWQSPATKLTNALGLDS